MKEEQLTEDHARAVLQSAEPGDPIVAAALIFLHGMRDEPGVFVKKQRRERKMRSIRRALVEWINHRVQLVTRIVDARSLVNELDVRASCESSHVQRDDIDNAAMQIIDAGGTDPENWARTKGLLAMLSLPLKPRVEIEISPDKWAPVEDIIIDDKGMTFIWGRNGSTVKYRYDGEKCPHWRVCR